VRGAGPGASDPPDADVPDADVRVVRGEPGAEELAALLVVWARLTAVAGPAAAGRRTRRRPPGRPLLLTGTVAPEANAWRRSAWPS